MYCVNLNEFYWLCHSGLVKHCPLLDLWLSCRCYKHKLFNLCKNEQKVRKSPTALWEKNQQHHISQSHIFFEIEEQLLCLLWFQQVYPGNRCALVRKYSRRWRWARWIGFNLNTTHNHFTAMNVCFTPFFPFPTTHRSSKTLSRSVE